MRWNHIIDLDQTYPHSKIWVTSDLHLFHNNAIKHATRPYKDVYENYDAVLKEIEEKVKPEDFLIILGDTIWQSQTSRITNFFKALPTSRVIVVFGNHDREKNYSEVVAQEIIMSAGRLEHIKVRIEGIEYEFNFCHYPLLTWNRKHFGSMMIHGHCHGNLDEYNESVPDLRVDVGWDSKLANNHFVEIREILEYFKKKTNGEDFAKWNNANCHIN